MDFLLFNQLISRDVLIVFYYLGACVMPIAGWLMARWLVRKSVAFDAVSAEMKSISWRLLGGRQKIRLLSVFAAVFIVMELFWRMLFEFLIAYMQIRDALVQMPCL